MAENINLGAVQAPYWEHQITLKPHETRVVNYIYDSFNLIYTSINNVLEVTFGGAAVQSKFSTGMGFKLSQPVYYIQFFNPSDQELTLDFALAIGGITDNRLTVSGVVDTRITESIDIFTKIRGFATYNASSATAPTTIAFSAGNTVSILCTSGTIILNLNVTGCVIDNLKLTSGMVWSDCLNVDGTIEISGTGEFNWTVGRY